MSSRRSFHLHSVFCVIATASVLPAQDAPGRVELPIDEMQYRCVGPTRGGRVTTVEGVVGRKGTFYMGATGGGVWRTHDFGRSWQPISDGAFASPSIGAIAVAQSDPDVVYVGTGSDGLRSNVIIGKGVYKSTDAGDTWKSIGLEKAGLIGAVEVHPFNEDVVFVAAIGNPFAPNKERGLFRSQDGGASWEHVLFVSERTGAVDVEFCPADPNVLFACTWQADRKPWTIQSGGQEGGVYRSVDAGATWHKLDNGLPVGSEDTPVGKSDLAVTAADPTRVYVLIEAPGDEGGLYRSFDRGESFHQVSDSGRIRMRPFYYTNVDCNPSDADDVFVSATGLSRSLDGGKTWRSVRTQHGDNHDLWIDPTDPEVWVQANDGGACVTTDGGGTWSSIENQATAELYQVAVDNRTPYWLYAGQQDNSTIRVPSAAPYRHPAGARGFWEAIGGCETGPVIPSPVDPAIVYANCKGRFGVYNARTGQEQHYDVGAANMYGHNPKDLKFRFQRVAPIAVSPHDPERVYHCSQYVHVTEDRGVTWRTISPDLTANLPERQVISGTPITRDITGEEFYSTLYSIKESTVQAGVIWVGANDGLIHVTQDGGASWRNVTPPRLPAGGRVQTVEPSPHRAGKAYVCVLRYQLDDWQPWVFRTEDFGQNWLLLTPGDNGVPHDHPARVVREDPVREGLLYLGTEWGMFVSLDDGGSWQSLQRNLPVTPVTDMQVHGSDLVLSTMGRSFWILDDLSPLRGFDVAKVAEPMLFEPREAIRSARSGGFGRGVPTGPPAGAILDYWLPEQVKPGELELEILDSKGERVRLFSATVKGQRRTTTEVDRMENVSERVLAEPRLETGKGHHRLLWDLRGAATADMGSGLRSRRGPRVLPGQYRIELRSGTGDSMVRRRSGLLVALDPRVAAEGVTLEDLQQQQQLLVRVQACMLAARAMVKELDKRLDNKDLGADDKKALQGLRSQLVTARGTYQQPMLLDQLGYLERIVGGADQQPGNHAVQRCAELEQLQKELAAKLPAATADAPPHDGGDKSGAGG